MTVETLMREEILEGGLEDEAPRTRRRPSGFERGALLLAALLCLANVVATFAECGLGPCCENGPCP